MSSEVSLGQVLETMTTGTKVRIVKDSDTLYIGTALDAFDTSDSGLLEALVISVKSTGLNSQLIRV